MRDMRFEMRDKDGAVETPEERRFVAKITF